MELAAGLTKMPKEVLNTYFITPGTITATATAAYAVSAVQKPIDAMVEYN